MLMPGCRSRSQRGAALVEFALIAPLFFLIVFGLVEFAIVFAGYCSAAYASQKGVRYAIVHGVDASGRVATDNTAIKALMSSYLWAAQCSGTNITITWNPDDSIGSSVSVNVSLTYTIGIPYFGSNQIQVGSTSTGTVLF
jgi:Flp pilus assembly protein TadG